MIKQLTVLFLALLLTVPAYPQDRQGRTQDKPLDSKRTGFAPAVTRYENLAPQDVTTWSALTGQATVTTGTTAPDGTTGAATLSITSPPDGYRRLYSTTRTISAGDYIVAGVWIKAVTVVDQAGQTESIENYNAATIQVYEATEGYQLDGAATNTRYLTPTDKADDEWEFISAVYKVTRATPDKQAQIRFDLNCTNRKTLAYYAPVLHHITSANITDTEAEGLLENLYAVPNNARPGTIALLKDQSLSGTVYDAGGGWINIKSHKYGAVGDGATDDTAEIQAAITDAASEGKAVYIPEGRYLISSTLTGISNGFVLRGSGMRNAILVQATANTPVIEITGGGSHSVRIEDIGIEGAGASSGSSGHGIYVHDNSGLVFTVVIRNVEVRLTGGKGIYLLENFSTLIDSVSVSDIGDNAIEMEGDNSTTLLNCYVHNLATGKIGYRVYSGSPTLIGCNGIDSGTDTWWGVFGKAVSDGDDVDAYARVSLIGSNVEDSRYGVRMKAGSWLAYNDGTTFWAPANTSGCIAIQLDGIDANTTGLITSGTRFALKSGASWLDSSPVRSNIVPFIQHGQRLSQYYDTALSTLVNLPYDTTARNSTTNSGSHYISNGSFGTLDSNLVFSQNNTRNIGDSGFTGAPANVYVGTSLLMANGATTVGGQNWTITGGASPQYAFNDGTVAGRFQLLTGSYLQFGTTTNHNTLFLHNGTGIFTLRAIGLIPETTDTYQFGGDSNRWTDGFFSGSLNLKERTAPSTPSANTLVVYAKDKSGTSALYYKNDAGTETEIGGGGGSGTVNSGVSGALAFYPSTGTTVDDTSGITHQSGASPNLSITAQNSAHVPLLLQLISSQTANALEVKNSGGSLVAAITPSGGLSLAGDSTISLTSASTTFPRKVSLSNVGSGTAFRLELESEGTGLQTRDAGKLQIQARYGVKIVGTRNSTTAPSFESGATTDPALYLENGVTGAIPFRVNAISSTSTNLIELQSNGSNVISATTAGRWTTVQLAGSGSAPSTSTGTGAGTSPTLTIDGNDITGAILLTTGTTPATNSKICDLTLSASFASYPVVMITAGNAAAATALAEGRLFVDDAVMLANKWTLKSGGTALSASTDYVFYYHVIGF